MGATPHEPGVPHEHGVNDYMKAVAEYRKTWPTKQDVIEQTPDPAVRGNDSSHGANRL